MNKNKPTNVIFSNEKMNPMRLILGLPGDANRKEYDALHDKGLDEDYEPIVIARKAKPTEWIEDDICFVLDNMVEGCGDDWPEGLNEWWSDIEAKDRKVGDKFVFKADDLTITASVDGTPMTDLRLLEESEL